MNGAFAIVDLLRKDTRLDINSKVIVTLQFFIYLAIVEILIKYVCLDINSKNNKVWNPFFISKFQTTLILRIEK